MMVKLEFELDDRLSKDCLDSIKKIVKTKEKVVLAQFEIKKQLKTELLKLLNEKYDNTIREVIIKEDKWSNISLKGSFAAKIIFHDYEEEMAKKLFKGLVVNGLYFESISYNEFNDNYHQISEIKTDSINLDQVKLTLKPNKKDQFICDPFLCECGGYLKYIPNGPDFDLGTNWPAFKCITCGKIIRNHELHDLIVKDDNNDFGEQEHE